MTKVNFYEKADDHLLKFAVIISKSNGKWVLCKHNERNTLEVPGGTREPGEDISETAERELREETGAIKYTIEPVCVYSVENEQAETFGMLYYAEISTFENELHSEIERVFFMDSLPDNWTYPLIQPELIREVLRRNVIKGGLI